MKALRLTKIGEPLELQEIQIPTFGEKDVLIRIKACGICHSDTHYRAGRSSVGTLPITLGHEISGVVEEVGRQVTQLKAGDHVCVHYMLICNSCSYCSQGFDNFCTSGRMIGKSANGGYAEFISIPEQNAIHVPNEIPFEQAAILMCSSATAFHAFQKSRIKPGESIAIFGLGGLGMSAVQMAKVFGAFDVFGVDRDEDKLLLASQYGVIPVNAMKSDPAVEIRRLTGGKGVDVAIEFVGLPLTMQQATQSLSVFGRAVIVGVTPQSFGINSYRDLLWREAEIIGSVDHLLQELPMLIETVRRGLFDMSHLVTNKIPLEAKPVNTVLDDMENFTHSGVRTVIVP
jgi:D-arabinose 1-dehydrogenase-like Zn-dependent alcohol dehydrogenase